MSVLIFYKILFTVTDNILKSKPYHALLFHSIQGLVRWLSRAIKGDNLSLLLKTHRVEGEYQLLQSCPLTATCEQVHVHTLNKYSGKATGVCLLHKQCFCQSRLPAVPELQKPLSETIDFDSSPPDASLV